MTEREYTIGVTFIYSDGRRETITVFRQGTDEETSRHAVWHEYKERFADGGDICLITSLIGTRARVEGAPAEGVRSENRQPQLSKLPPMIHDAGHPASSKNQQL